MSYQKIFFEVGQLHHPHRPHFVIFCHFVKITTSAEISAYRPIGRPYGRKIFSHETKYLKVFVCQIWALYHEQFKSYSNGQLCDQNSHQLLEKKLYIFNFLNFFKWNLPNKSLLTSFSYFGFYTRDKITDKLKAHESIFWFSQKNTVFWPFFDHFVENTREAGK